MPELACPVCRQHLQPHEDGNLQCHACAVDYPYLGDVPFCWRVPSANLADWRLRFSRTLAELEARQHHADAAIGAAPERLEALRDGLQAQRSQLEQLLEPLNVGPVVARETYIALGTRLPPHHDLLAYTQNIFRDWSWGEAENTATADALLGLLRRHRIDPIQSILVLGAGAGRLAYDLHAALAPIRTWALDSNPLLCLIADRMVRGESCALTEFPIAPVRAGDCAVLRRLSAPAPAPGLHVVCADAVNPPFNSGAFDLVVTPWLIDVVDCGLSEFTRIINDLLVPGGLWVESRFRRIQRIAGQPVEYRRSTGHLARGWIRDTGERRYLAALPAVSQQPSSPAGTDLYATGAE